MWEYLEKKLKQQKNETSCTRCQIKNLQLRLLMAQKSLIQ